MLGKEMPINGEKLMKISKRQLEEIEFYSKEYREPFEPTQEEMEEYINETVNGIKVSTQYNINRISASKRNFEITISMWRTDLVNGLLGINELYEDYGQYPFGRRLIDSVLKSLDFDKYKPDEGYATIAGFNALKKYESR